MPELNLEALRVAAEGATPGPWTTVEGDTVRSGIDGPGGIAVVWLTSRFEEGIPRVKDARFIALANPATILQLIARLEASERDGERYRWLKDVALDFKGRSVLVHEFIGPIAYGENIDAAIDEAIQNPLG